MLLERMILKRIIFASSSAIFGDLDILPKAEDMRCNPISPYGVSKLAYESYMQAFHKVYDLDTVNLRYLMCMALAKEILPIVVLSQFG
jgi:UDP-glucose 4-epimerase